MTKFVVKTDEEGREYSQFEAKLVQITSGPKQMKNDNKTEFRSCIIEIETEEGISQESAIIYEKNIFDENGEARMEEGETYLTTCRSDEEGNAFISVSHLHGLLPERSKASKFGLGTVTKKIAPKTNVLPKTRTIAPKKGILAPTVD